MAWMGGSSGNGEMDLDLRYNFEGRGDGICGKIGYGIREEARNNLISNFGLSNEEDEVALVEMGKTGAGFVDM